FDAWTRRRLGLTAGGLASSLLGLAALGTARAKKGKNKKKKRCGKLLQRCAPEGKNERCCQGLNCDPVDTLDGLRCCFGRQHHCQSAAQCCGDTLCDDVSGLDGDRCCGRFSAFCTSDDDCCSPNPCSGGRCEPPGSDRAIKANFGSVDGQDMLQRVRDLPISTWNYRSDSPDVRHIGPMAQDFTALFGVGADDRHIHPLDGQGVALAAIQGLAELVAELREENVRLAARVDELEQVRG
ncbi:MAG: tail fiber domain-containing protein, partial [Thermomicrobiales bacterium]